MGLLPDSLRLIIYLHKKDNFKGPVLTLGNLDIWSSYEDLKSVFNELDCPYSTPEKILKHTSHDLGPSYDFVHARTFFQMLGIKEYFDIDKFDYDKPVLFHDLNEPIPHDFYDKFSLIIDGGTIEHIFDVKQVMFNIVNMVKIGGWVLHFSPCSNLIDHGFYSYSPGFFYDFYVTNGFENCVCYIMQLDPANYFKPTICFKYKPGMVLDNLIDKSRQILACFAGQKTIAMDQPIIPTQKYYQRDVSDKLEGMPLPALDTDLEFTPAGLPRLDPERQPGAKPAAEIVSIRQKQSKFERLVSLYNSCLPKYLRVFLRPFAVIIMRILMWIVQGFNRIFESH